MLVGSVSEVLLPFNVSFLIWFQLDLAFLLIYWVWVFYLAAYKTRSSVLPRDFLFAGLDIVENNVHRLKFVTTYSLSISLVVFERYVCGSQATEENNVCTLCVRFLYLIYLEWQFLHMFSRVCFVYRWEGKRFFFGSSKNWIVSAISNFGLFFCVQFTLFSHNFSIHTHKCSLNVFSATQITWRWPFLSQSHRGTNASMPLMMCVMNKHRNQFDLYGLCWCAGIAVLMIPIR